MVPHHPQTSWHRSVVENRGGVASWGAPEHPRVLAAELGCALVSNLERGGRSAGRFRGSKQPGADAYATSKQAILAAAMAFARETPRLHFNAVEPGVNPGTGLARDAGAFVRFLSRYLVPLFMPFIKVLSTPKRAARVITKVLLAPRPRLSHSSSPP